MYPSLVELYYIWPHGGLILDQPISLEWYHTCKITFGFPWTTLSYNTYFDAFTHAFLEMLAHVSRVHSSCAHDLNALLVWIHLELGSHIHKVDHQRATPLIFSLDTHLDALWYFISYRMGPPHSFIGLFEYFGDLALDLMLISWLVNSSFHASTFCTFFNKLESWKLGHLEVMSKMKDYGWHVDINYYIL